MNVSKKLFLMLSLSALLIPLSGCMGGKSPETFTINNADGYEGVLVSGATSLVETSGYEEILVSGEDNVNALIDVLNGKGLVKASDEELQEKSKELEMPGSYRVLLYNKPSVNNSSEDIYPILFYKDGTIQVNQEGDTYFIENPPKDLLTQLISDWNITF